jgi:hypothetical protein
VWQAILITVARPRGNLTRFPILPAKREAPGHFKIERTNQLKSRPDVIIWRDWVSIRKDKGERMKDEPGALRTLHFGLLTFPFLPFAIFLNKMRGILGPVQELREQ